MKQEAITFRKLNLAAYTNQNKKGKPIIFLHGNSMSSKIWKKQFSSSALKKYHLIAFDMLGFGNSDHSSKPEKDYTVKAMTESLKEVIKHYKLNNYVLVGHSLGGHIIAQSLNSLPGTKGIFSLAAPPLDHNVLPTDIFNQLPTLGKMFTAEYPSISLDQLSKSFFLKAVPRFFNTDFNKADGLARQQIGIVLSSTKNYLSEAQVLKKKKIPIALTLGSNEVHANRQYYSTLKFPTMWNNGLNLISDSAHCPQWENARSFNKLLTDFLKAIKY